MFKFRISKLKRNNTKKDNPIYKKIEKEKASPLNRLATKIKRFLHAHFPDRTWPKPQENKKGPRF